MTLTHATSTRNAMADAAVDQADAGSTNPTGAIRLFEGGVGGTQIVEFDDQSATPIQDPMFDAASSGSASLANSPQQSAGASTSGSGIDTAQILDKDRNAVMEMAVGESYTVNTISGQDIDVADSNQVLPGRLSRGDQVRLENDATYTVTSVSGNTPSSGVTRVTVAESITGTASNAFVPGEVKIQNRNVNSGQNITIQSATYTAAP